MTVEAIEVEAHELTSGSLPRQPSTWLTTTKMAYPLRLALRRSSPILVTSSTSTSTSTPSLSSRPPTRSTQSRPSSLPSPSLRRPACPACTAQTSAPPSRLARRSLHSSPPRRAKVTETQFDQIAKIAKARTEERDKLVASVSSAVPGLPNFRLPLINADLLAQPLRSTPPRSARRIPSPSPSRKLGGSVGWTLSQQPTQSTRKSPQSVPIHLAIDLLQYPHSMIDPVMPLVHPPSH